MATTRETEATLLAFVAGAALGAGMALLLTPTSGKEVRGKIGDVTGIARERLFRKSRRNPDSDYGYDGGDYFV